MSWAQRYFFRLFLPLIFTLSILGILCAAAPLDVHAAAQETTIGGVITFRDPISTDTALYDNITITPAYGRTVKLYCFDTAKQKWIAKAIYKLKDAKTAKLRINYTDDWKTLASSQWRIKVLKADGMKVGRANVKIHNRSVDTFKKTYLGDVWTAFDKPYTKTLQDKISVCPAYGRKVNLYIYNDGTGKWKK